MKVPLRFQITEKDSAQTTLLNTVSYLFEREYIDTSLVKSIYKYVIKENDIFKDQKSVCEFCYSLLNKKKYNLSLELLKNDDVNLKVIKDKMKSARCMITRLYLNGKSHYTLITDIDNNYAYCFDPYYLDEIYYDEERMVELSFDHPFEYNRKINLKRLGSLTLNDFSLGPIDHRECLIIC